MKNWLTIFFTTTAHAKRTSSLYRVITANLMNLMLGHHASATTYEIAVQKDGFLFISTRKGKNLNFNNTFASLSHSLEIDHEHCSRLVAETS